MRDSFFFLPIINLSLLLKYKIANENKNLNKK